jgi:hypothetical protein
VLAGGGLNARAPIVPVPDSRSLSRQRGIPASYRLMHGFGSHTCSFRNAKGERVEFQFRTQQGIRNLTGAKAGHAIAGDRETHQRDPYDAIEDELRVDNLDLATFICVTSIEAMTHNAVLHRSDMLSDATVEEFIDAAARRVVGYLGSS